LNKVIAYERHYAEEMVRLHGYDLLFSDNRFGFYSEKARSVYMTHQCRIAFPAMASWLEGIGIRWHRGIMKRFDEVWIPDLEGEPGYAGTLSHVKNLQVPVKYVGPLSRFSELVPGTGPVAENGSRDLNVVAVVSGVEPARSQFENSLKKVLAQVPGNHAVILGKPAAGQKSWTEGNICFYSHLETEEFARMVNRARWVVSRGGYSTVMDMAVLGTQCIFVPTPGQYEQAALARELSRKGYAVHIPAKEFGLQSLMQAMETQVALPKPPREKLLPLAVQEVLKKV